MMATDPRGPADTSMMRIVHTALRRDLARAQFAISSPPYPDAVQRAALCAHLRWVIGFIHRHHESEDLHLYPMVRAANPSVGKLLDVMAADHDAVQNALGAAEQEITRYERSAVEREELVGALDSLSDVLLPHLRREEDEAMPVVSATSRQRRLASS